jgi:hypothetical protein
VTVQVSTACSCAACQAAAAADAARHGGGGSPAVGSSAPSALLEQAERFALRAIQASVASALLDRTSTPDS